MDLAAARAGGQDHAFGDAELHLARRQVGNVQGQATFELTRLRVGALDAGEDVALGIADVQGQAQELVGAFDEFGLFDQGDAQVDLGEGVEINGLGQRGLGQFAIAGGLGSGLGGQVFLGSVDHGLHLGGFDAGEQGLEGIELMIGQAGVEVGPGQGGDVEEGLGGGGQVGQYRLEQDRQLAEQLDALGADGLDFVGLAVLLGQAPGRLVGDPGVGAVGQGHDLAHGTAEVTGLVGLGDAGRGGAEGGFQLGGGLGVHQQAGVALVDEAGAAAGDVDHLAHQVGIDLLHEVLEVQVDVLDVARELGGEVVAQVFGIQVIQVGARLDEGAAGLGHLLAVDGKETVDVQRRRLAVAGAFEHGRPEQRMEVDDVLADEVVQLGRAVLGPVGVEVQVVATVAEILEAGHVADGRVQPDIEVLARGIGNLEAEVGRIAGDVPFLQAGVQPFGDLVGHRFLQGAAAGPALEHLGEVGKLEEEVLGFAQHRGRAGDGRLGILQFGGRVGGAALLAVVAVLVGAATLGTGALDEAVGQEHLLVRVEILGDRTGGDVAVLAQLQVDGA